MPREERRSFSVGRKWTISLNVAIASLALAAWLTARLRA